MHTVLVVDDQHHTRQFLRNVLARAGYDVLEASDQDSACCAIEQHPHAVELAIIDVDLDGDSGRSVAEAVQGLTAVPVLFMSGHSLAQLVDDGQLPPDVRFLPKPFTVSAILDAVTATIGPLEAPAAVAPQRLTGGR